MNQSIVERTEKLIRFTSRAGGLKHSCAIIIFDEDFRLVYANPIVSRLFGITHLNNKETFFKDVFSKHNQIALRNLFHLSTLSTSWEQSQLVVNHMSRELDRNMQVHSRVFSGQDSGKAYVLVFSLNEELNKDRKFVDLFKNAIEIPFDSIAKISIENDENVISDRVFHYFEDDLCAMFQLERHQLANASLGELLSAGDIPKVESLWRSIMGGYLDGYAIPVEFIDSAGGVFGAWVTLFRLTQTVEHCEYLMFTAKDTLGSPRPASSISPDSMMLALDNAEIAVGYVNGHSVTLANRTLITWMGGVRSDNLSLIHWAQQIIPGYRKQIRKIWDNRLRKAATFTFEAVLKSDPQSVVTFTVHPQGLSKDGYEPHSLLLVATKRLSARHADMRRSESRISIRDEGFKERISDKGHNLTHAEMRVAALIKRGKGSKEIAKEISISPGTVNIHRKNIRKKLELTGNKINLKDALSLLDEL